jgi:predicted MFS family arabinose efflux permease
VLDACPDRELTATNHGLSPAWVTAALTAERLVPAGERMARAIGIVVIGIGLFLSCEPP